MAQSIFLNPVNPAFPAIVANARKLAQTGPVATVCSYTPPVDGTFLISMGALITVTGTFNFALECTYTDEGNTARTIALNSTKSDTTGAVSTQLANAAGLMAYASQVIAIRAKAGTLITLLTQPGAGNYTSVTFNVEGTITQIA